MHAERRPTVENTHAEAALEIVQIGSELYERGLVSGTGGNLSVRLPGDQILLTPASTSLGHLETSRLCVVDLDGRPLSGPRPTKETPLHIAAYRSSDAVGGVVHTHSPYALTLASMLEPGARVPTYTPGFAAKVGDVDLTRFAIPGTQALAEETMGALRGRRAVLLANHGVVAVGRDLAAASNVAMETEENAKVHVLSSGRARELEPEVLAQVRALYR